jgi:hypothetical protein
MVEQWLSTSEVAKMLRVPEHRVQGAVRLGIVTPRMVKGRRCWFNDDVELIARHLDGDATHIRNRNIVGSKPQTGSTP